MLGKVTATARKNIKTVGDLERFAQTVTAAADYLYEKDCRNVKLEVHDAGTGDLVATLEAEL